MLLAAVSGGADSTAMLAALASLRDTSPKGAFALRCLHVEHGIRPAEERGGDAAFVRELCAGFDTPCTVVSVPPGKIARAAKREGAGIEAAARIFRRRALLREARKLSGDGSTGVRILTAHTRDDLLETALMRILRGAGPAGLAAIPPGRGRFLRPLLGVSRAGVLRYLAEKNLSWREDSTNADIRFLRNRIRRRLIPLLDELFPYWRRGLQAVAETQALAAGFIGDEARRRVDWRFLGGGALCAGAGDFFAQPAIIREEALFRGIDRLPALRGGGNPAPVRRAGVRRFCAGSVSAADLGPVRVRRSDGRIRLSPRNSRASERGFARLIKAPGLYTLKGVTIAVRPGGGSAGENGPEGGFRALLPLVLRPALNGDRLVCGGRKTAPRDLADGPERGRLWSAVDRLGTAAFIGPRGLLAAREFPGGGAEFRLTVQVTKGAVPERGKPGNSPERQELR